MKAAIKFLVTTILVCSAFVLHGCGTAANTQSKPQQQPQTIEEQAEQFAKMSCASPGSYKKVGYTANEKGGFAKLDFTFKNEAGNQVPGTMYFSISKGQISHIKTDGVPEEFLKETETTRPDSFSETLAAYNDLQKLNDIMDVEYSRVDLDFDLIEDEDHDPHTFYMWKRLINLTSANNVRIRNYKEAYNKAPEHIKKYFNGPPKYFKVTLNGTPESWEGTTERTDAYPDK